MESSSELLGKYKDKISGKLYGKQWVYVTRQDELPAPSQAELNDMDAEMEKLKTELMALKDEVWLRVFI